MKKEFKFNKEKHIYTLDDKPLTGVTTILSVIGGSKVGALIQWSANQAVGYIEKVLAETIKGVEIDWATVLKEARFAHRKKKEDAGSVGTDIHAVIEEWVRARIEGKKTFAEHKEKQVQHFIDWAVKHDVKFLESEKRMYSEKYFIAGTVDVVCKIDGEKFVLDIKTSSGIYDKVPMIQCAGYRLMLEEMGEENFKGSIIINIKKSGVFDEDKDVYYSYDYETDKEIFLSALNIYRGLATFKNGR